MAKYRQRMRAAGFRPVQIWLPDTRAADFIEQCRGQAEAIAAHDPAGVDIMHFVAIRGDWPNKG